jgi:tRNA(fMet)-specific endonuclease VapC
MARRLILDTGVLIAAERGRARWEAALAPDDDPAIAAVTVAELRTGVELADAAHRLGRAEFLMAVLETVPIEPYDLAVAEAHGRLLAHVHRAGSRRGAHDLLIAATAVATGRIVLTTDQGARFGDLPGVDCIVAV